MNNVRDKRLRGPGQVRHTRCIHKVNPTEELNPTFVKPTIIRSIGDSEPLKIIATFLP